MSTSGSDGNPGTPRRPFATLERARDEVRRLKALGRMPVGGLTVWIEGGDHVRSRPLTLTAEDSGTPAGPVVWRGRGDRARLLGGTKLSGFLPVSDPAVLDRLDPAARGHILQLDLKTAGVQETGGLKSRGFARPTTQIGRAHV